MSISARELAILGQKMRKAQAAYFQSRKSDDLAASVKAEREFDAGVYAVLNGEPPKQSSMFPETQNEGSKL